MKLAFIWIYACATYLTTKSIIDGGLFTIEFLVGFALLIILFSEKQLNKKHYLKLFLKYFFIPTTLISSIPIFLAIKINELSLQQIIITIGKLSLNTAALTFFIFIIYYIISFFEEKKLKKIIISIVLFLLVIFCFSWLNPSSSDSSMNYFEQFNKLIKPLETRDKLWIAEKTLCNRENIEILDSSKEMLFIQIKNKTTLQEISCWPNNIKTTQYALNWREECNMLLDSKRILIRTNETIGKLPNISLFSGVNVKECKNNCDYELFFYHTYCMKNFRPSTIEFLKRAGLKKFILYER